MILTSASKIEKRAGASGIEELEFDGADDIGRQCDRPRRCARCKAVSFDLRPRIG